MVFNMASYFLVTNLFVLAPCVRYDYNSLKSCWFCDEKLLLSCCDTHFSALLCYSLTISNFSKLSIKFYLSWLILYAFTKISDANNSRTVVTSCHYLLCIIL